ncbi:pyruvate dehydrogenase complex dihydrolipoyllysine-residue acetyltransferase [Gallaecimonas kandeliae]|uniref:pyruvate dehydrogenase complex dihydrolipoyllysine-residue acetyltransferase n=1 Tax=Gallaecimonas kandeliae TaxID=3029055 RepID=UPI002649E2E5|nr:pyruvate dehydrogenase complex dihydrolipoyllysine-residue acetyltransferase [Gallaecimonas kandeliae]WKE66112.1 pyruvate dehydrogenase complex dihydrolipoyllysine-residue acetyltransferase [Gallaecimonas kandeliae]
MAETRDLIVPDIGSDAVDVTELLVAVGDSVEEEQGLISVEGDKAAMEVPAPFAGTIKSLSVKVGDKVSTGDVIGSIEVGSAEGAAAGAAEAAPVAPAAQVEAAPAPAAAGARQEVLLPDAGGEVEVVEILVAVGDMVEAEQGLVSVEGDKAAMEVPSPLAGKIVEIKVKTGDKVSEGSLIAVIETGAVAAAPAASAAVETVAPVAAAPAAKAVKDVTLPDAGGEVQVVEILVAVGDVVEAEQGLISVEGDKAAMEVPAPFAGTVIEVLVKTGDAISEGTLIARIETVEAAPAPQAAAPAAAPSAAPVAASASAAKPPPVPHHPSAGVREPSGKVHASPSVRRLGREFGVDLSLVSGTGRKGRILKEDVQAYVKAELARPKAAAGATSGGGNVSVIDWPKVDWSKFGEVEVVKMSRIQKISGPNLHRNWVQIPHVTQFDEADITELEAFRKSQNDVATKQQLGFKISPLVFIMKAAAKALELHPKFNCSIGEDGESLVMKKFVHIGIAVDTPNGLVVPVVRDVNKKGIYELSKELGEISAKARAGKLTAADMQGSSFTISSLGGIGGTQFTPIVNAPDVAILGVSKSDFKPKWNGKDFEARLMVPLALSYDHRVIDGADGARFVTTLSDILGDLRQLIL